MDGNSYNGGLILLVTDKDEATDRVDRLLGAMGPVQMVSVTCLATLPHCRPALIVYDIDLDSISGLRNIRLRLSWPELRDVPRFLISDRADVRNLALNALLEVTDVIARPITREGLLRAFRRLAATAFEDTLAAQPHSVRTGLVGLNRVFDKMLSSTEGESLPWSDVAAVEASAIDAIRAASLDGWLDIVEQHHSATFRHCLSVTGIAVAFAQELRFGEAEQRRIARAAIIHDIGKASIPLEILDKPGKLTVDEMKVMQTHPQIGYDMIVSEPDVSTDVIDMVLHHHELLDGSGYPHGLKGAEIAPMVRLITIADIFSALIEKRSYKEAFSRQRGYDILLSMEGLLDRSMVAAFAPVALGGTRLAA